MTNERTTVVALIGPTASGKTRLGARLAKEFRGEIISADSRQVYRGLNLGAGKDLEEYVIDGVRIPHHLIDIVNLDEEFNVFAFQRLCREAIPTIVSRGHLPMIVGGTGFYIDAVLNSYAMVEAPENTALRVELEAHSTLELQRRLVQLRPKLHNTTDLLDRQRLVRAIEIAEAKQTAGEPSVSLSPILLGMRWPREELSLRIRDRLRERLETGMIDEVHALHTNGVSWDRLYLLGLEYRFVAAFLRGEIKSKNDLQQKLHAAIYQFARKQESWFRRMERNGAVIHWIERADYKAARSLLASLLPARIS